MQAQLFMGMAALAVAFPGTCRWHDHAAKWPHKGSGDDAEEPVCEPPEDEEPGPACRWSAAGDGLGGGIVPAIAFDPQTPGRAYVATPGGLQISDDLGETYGPAAEDTGGITQLVLTPTAGVLYGATHDGIIRTGDGGSTWEPQSLQGLSISALAVHPDGPQHVYAAAWSTPVLASIDGGASFKPAFPWLHDGAVFSLVPRAGGPLKLAAGLRLPDPVTALASGAVYVTDDGGASWQQTLGGDPVLDLVTCPAKPEVMWAVQGFGGLSRSDDAGQTWTQVAFPAGAAQLVVVRGDDCERVYGANWNGGFHRSADGGQTWTGPHNDGIGLNRLSAISIDVSWDGDDVILLGTHGGLFRSTDRGDSWHDVPGIGQVEVRGLDPHAVAGGPLFMHTWGSGLWRLDGAQWSRVTGYPEDRGQMVASSPHDPDHIYAGDLRSTDGGQTWSQPAGVSTAFDVAFHPTDPSIVVMVTQLRGFLRSFDGGATFEEANGGLSPWPTPDAVAIDMRDAVFHGDAIYVATHGRGVYRTEDYGASFEAATPSLPQASVSGLVSNGDELLALVRGSGPYLYDGSTWEPFAEGLVSLDVRDAVWDAAAERWYVSTAAGLYTTNGLQAWSLLEDTCDLGVGKLTLIGEGEDRRLVVAAEGGVLHRPFI